jgi:hypothetical protein
VFLVVKQKGAGDLVLPTYQRVQKRMIMDVKALIKRSADGVDLEEIGAFVFQTFGFGRRWVNAHVEDFTPYGYVFDGNLIKKDIHTEIDSPGIPGNISKGGGLGDDYKAE